MNRTANVVRMQLINRNTFIWVPLLILAGSFALTLAINGVIDSSVTDAAHQPKYSGGAQAPLYYLAVVGVQAMTLTFPFSQALSVTRREFYSGTLLTAAAASAVLTLIYLIGGAIEDATHGWGFDSYFFHLPWIWSQGPVVAALLYFTAPFFFFVVGFLAANIFKRFGLLWLVVVGLTILAAIVLAAFFIGRADAWASVGHWFATLKPLTVAAIGLGASAVFAGISYGILRRTIP
ncbi:MAG: hypothetical protein QM774_08440 [Gordonia sp. (in: high G+C Gram-positive bacteria)]|uniref:hypothetical protein n=1 Tax=Gordonia sp. (in: high G+C Gram-positive bacteria) TaxID=84139 RepID=UPI0039E54D8C